MQMIDRSSFTPLEDVQGGHASLNGSGMLMGEDSALCLGWGWQGGLRDAAEVVLGT